MEVVRLGGMGPRFGPRTPQDLLLRGSPRSPGSQPSHTVWPSLLLVEGWGGVGVGGAPGAPHALPVWWGVGGWGAGPAHTHDPELSATAMLCPQGPFGALLHAEVDAIVLKLDAYDGENGLGGVTGLEDAAIPQGNWLGC